MPSPFMDPVNAAASVLNVTNSAISQQIVKLERELGQRHVQGRFTIGYWAEFPQVANLG
jgi:hypothetical protein